MTLSYLKRRLVGFVRATALLIAMGFFAVTAGWGGESCCSSESAGDPAKALEATWGMQIASLRLSAQGRMIDFRYKVIDPKKAATLGNREFKPYLIDQASGAKLMVPKTPKVGPLRQASDTPAAGKIYWMFFANPGTWVKSGSKVTIVIGDFRAENLIVE